jgi:hypothetical protein
MILENAKSDVAAFMAIDGEVVTIYELVPRYRMVGGKLKRIKL